MYAFCNSTDEDEVQGSRTAIAYESVCPTLTGCNWRRLQR